MSEPESDEVIVPQVIGVHFGVSFAGETPEPVVVVALRLADNQVHHYGFVPPDLQGIIPEMVESVIRAKTIMEMITTWPDQREEIIKNLAFRWTGAVAPMEDDGDGS